MSSEKLDIAGVERKFGVPPGRIVDYLTLVGDSVDNVPGVDKVGPKTAAKWLHEYGSLDDLIANAQTVKGAVGENLRKALPWLPTARKLVTIRDDCDLGHELESIDALAVQPQDIERLRELYTRYEFKPWLRELDNAAVTAAMNGGAVDGDAAPSPQTRPDVEYETVLSYEQLDAWLAKIGSADLDCARYRNNVARPDRSETGRNFAIGRIAKCVLPAARASVPRCAEATAVG